MSAPAVAVSRDGKQFVAAWKDLRTGKGDPNVYWSRSSTPDFTDDSLVHDDTRGVQNHPSVAIDGGGIAWVAWEDGRTGKPRIWVRSSRPDDSGRAISTDALGNAGFPTIVANAGLIATVFEAAGHGKKAVYFALVELQQ